MLRPLGISALVVLASALAACGPPRVGFDVQSDVGPTDVTLDTADASDAPDGTGDVRDAMDARVCLGDICDQACLSAGLMGGVCRMGMCTCLGGGDDGGADVVRRDAGADARPDAGIIGCTINDECPPTLFCNGAGCTSHGFCSPRTDLMSCDTTGPEVCGCDGVRYTNTCVRLAAGVRLMPAGTCGGTDGGTDASGDVTPRD